MTKDQAIEFLDTYGIETPDYLIDAILELVDGPIECLQLNYGPGVVTMIQSYLLALIALAQGGRLVTSQRAVNGASRSFQYKTTQELWRGLVGMITQLDTKECTKGMIPDNPAQTGFIGVWVGKAACRVGRA